MDRGLHTERESNPKEKANPLSQLSFFYTLKLFIKGYRKNLDADDLYEVLPGFSSKLLGDKLEEQWEILKKKSKNPSIFWALWNCFGVSFLILGGFKCIARTATTIYYAHSLSKLIAFFNPGQKDLTLDDAIHHASVVIAINLFNVFFYNHIMLAFVELGFKVRIAISSLLYRKSLRLEREALSDVTVGKITTVTTKDMDNLEVWIEIGNNCWIGLVQTAVICYLIYSKIGVASIPGMLFFAAVLPIQIWMAKMVFPIRFKASKKTDERMEMTQDILSAIKIIKMYTWERFFERRIAAARRKELNKIHKIFFLKIVVYVTGLLCSRIAFFIFVMCYVWNEHSVTAETVYYITSCFTDLQYAMNMLIPFGISQTAEAYAGIKRINSILHSQELSTPKPSNLFDKKPCIIFENCSLQCGDRILFKNFFGKLSGGLNILTGHIGSGKTTLLKMILRDVNTKGVVKINGRISYASQEPWLFPASIRNNILFGEKFDFHRYKNILELCALDYDLEALKDGDNTIVGDRGTNLSKGQQARINLARAVYRDSDIYLFDDCLAALDSYVSDKIFKGCITKFLERKLCLFVTNNIDYVEEADNVLLIDHGKITITKNVKRMEIPKNNNNNNSKKEYNGMVNAKSKKVMYEAIKEGKVDRSVYVSYVKYGGKLMAVAVLVTYVASQVSATFRDKLLSEWVTLEQNLSNFRAQNNTQSPEYARTTTSLSYTLNFYSITVFIAAAFSFLEFVVPFNHNRISSITLHNVMVHSIINGTMNFFDHNFIGNVLNRFSKDLMIVDEFLPFSVIDCLLLVVVAAGGIVLLGSVSILFFTECLVLFFFACVLKVLYQPTGRNLQRLNATSRAPMVRHLLSTLEGLTTIRSSKAEVIINSEFDRHQDLNTSANYMLNSCVLALCFILDLFCFIFSTILILQFLFMDMGASVGDVGLVITQSTLITDIVRRGVQHLSELENKMTSVERVLEYTDVPQEEPEGLSLDSNWPKAGSIHFDHVSLNYNENNFNMLENISFTIKSGEKVGIVGRTGAGKSSIISAIFRMYPIEGRVLIDGIEIKQVPLNQLRSSIAVIPQDPFLFCGTIRENLDPLDQFRDEQIWKVLKRLRLDRVISDLGLRFDKGWSISAGQKQLLCLVRAILRKNKILILDEATANVDEETDGLIHKAVEEYFYNCTVITVAHRLSSVLNCDRVMVLNKGRIVEFDQPANLLKDKSSFLNCVVK